MKNFVIIIFVLFAINKTFGQWTLVDSITSGINTVHYKPTCVFASKNTYQSASEIFISCNPDDLFSVVSYSGFSTNGISDIVHFGDSIYCISYDGILNLSIDNGITWNIIDTFMACQNLYIVEHYLFIYDYDFYRYNLFSNNVDTISLPFQNTPTSIIKNNNEIFLTASNGTSEPHGSFFKSSDNGQNWTIVNDTMVPVVWSFLILNENIIFASVYGLFKSVDNGISFYYITNGMGYCNDLLNINGTIVLGSQKGAFFSSDTATTWQSFNDGFTEQTGISKIIQVEDYLYAATNKGLWKRPLSDIVGLKQVNESIENKATAYYYESQLHINTIGLNGKTQIIIYDIQGRELFNEYSYFSNLNSNKNILLNNLSKGIYVLKLSNENLIISEKFVVQ